jgi:serine protease Do
MARIKNVTVLISLLALWCVAMVVGNNRDVTAMTVAQHKQSTDDLQLSNVSSAPERSNISNLSDVTSDTSWKVSATAPVTPTLQAAFSSVASLTVPQIVALTQDAVVEIRTETVTSSNRVGQFVSEGAGSGVLVSNDGYIVTNNHVIEGANKVFVRMTNGKTFQATLVGRDRETDIAVIRIAAGNLNKATYGDSNKLVVGELAVAIGNPLGQLGGTVTEGIISAPHRTIVIDGQEMMLLQTTTAINPGNSGGALFNAKAELIGIVNAKSSGSGIEGIGFAIPINIAKDIINQLIKYGYVLGRIDIGATLIDIPDDFTARLYRVREKGVYVSQTDNTTLLMSGDKIVSIGNKTVNTSGEVNGTLKSYKVGDTVKFVVKRSNQSLELDITLKQAKN